MNMQNLSAEQIERIAVRRVKAKMGWFFHAAIYVVVNLFLLAVATYNGKHWNIFPLFGWGLGLAIHGAVVWFSASITGHKLREGMIAKERTALGRTTG